MNKAIGSLKTNNSLKTRFFSVVFVKDEKKRPFLSIRPFLEIESALFYKHLIKISFFPGEYFYNVNTCF